MPAASRDEAIASAIEFALGHLRAGTPAAEVRDALAAGGWAAADIDELWAQGNLAEVASSGPAGPAVAAAHFARAGQLADEAISWEAGVSSYDTGGMGEVVAELEAAVAADPTSVEARCYLALAKGAMFGGEGPAEMLALAEEHPTYAEAAGFATHPTGWPGPWRRPPWRAQSTTVDRALLPSGDQLVLTVRDGCRRVVSFFRRIPRSDLGPAFRPDRKAAVRLAYRDTPHGGVIGAYALVDKSPDEPLIWENLLNPSAYHPDNTGDFTETGLWLARLLAQQAYTYVVLFEPGGKAYFNRKVKIDEATRKNLHGVAKQLRGMKLSPSTDVSRFQAAVKSFWDVCSLEEIEATVNWVSVGG